MQISFEQQLSLRSDLDEAWAFFADVRRVIACVPNISDFTEASPTQYTAVASDRVGPFRIGMAVDITVRVDPAQHRIEAVVGGRDRKSQTRLTGTLSATLSTAETAAVVAAISAKAEVLGPVATLGASPIRRRMDAIFSEFAQCVAGQFTGSQSVPD